MNLSSKISLTKKNYSRIKKEIKETITSPNAHNLCHSKISNKKTTENQD